jgi:GNAT superfamily N-acetyltransferase
VKYRRAEEGDVPRAAAVFRAALNSYLVPAGQQPIPEDDQQSPLYLHLLRHDAERFWVAEADVEELTDGGTGSLGVGGRQIVGWGCGLLRGDWWFLSNLFVLPEAHGMGIGARLFELAATGAPPGAVRATVTDSIQPVSNTLYARRGLLPREVLIGFDGEPRASLAPPALGTLVPERLTLDAIPELREIDAAAAGVDRSVDHRFYLTHGGRFGLLFRRRGRAVGYAVVRRDGWVGPVATVREPDMETVTAHGIAHLVARGVTDKVRAGVTGRSEGAQRAFWGAGLRFSGTPGLLLSSRPFGRLDRYVAASYGMF